MIDTRPDVDLADGHFYAGNSRAAYQWMRANEPVFRDRNGLAASSTYRALVDAERQPEIFCNSGGIRPDFPPLPFMIDMDDPAHLLRRKLVNSAFTRKRVTEKLGSITDLCDTLIDAICERGECDFVRDIAAPLPMVVIGDMLGVQPEERSTLLQWSDDLLTGLGSQVDETTVQTMMAASAAYTAFATDIIAKRRKKPTDDMFSVLVHAEVEGQTMSDDEIVVETLLILIGGDETTRHTLSGGIEQLLRNPGEHDKLRNDPQLLSGAVEEMLRWTSPIKNMCRTLTADVEFHGTQLKSGEKMLLLFESANFDEATFDRPEAFQIERRPNNHLAFGFGAHFCLGNQLARLELITMTRRLLERLPDIQLADEDALPLRPANFVSGPESMPVVFTPTAPLVA